MAKPSVKDKVGELSMTVQDMGKIMQDLNVQLTRALSRQDFSAQEAICTQGVRHSVTSVSSSLVILVVVCVSVRLHHR
jgi:hypothetical protein